jgi:AcrR family transcriptional regulator
MAATPPLTDTLAHRAVERAVAEKRAELAEGMQRAVESTYALVEQTGNIDPPMRQILAETGLSTQAFYRLFRSKDELMLALLDDGRRRLVAHLERRMQRDPSPDAQVRAWIEGVMAQGADGRAAARTRPFVAGEDRLAEMFPSEHQASVEQLVSLLVPPLAAMRGAEGDGAELGARARRDADAVYRLTFATLRDHLLARQRPAPETVEHLVGFALAGVGDRR